MPQALPRQRLGARLLELAAGLGDAQAVRPNERDVGPGSPARTAVRRNGSAPHRRLPSRSSWMFGARAGPSARMTCSLPRPHPQDVGADEAVLASGQVSIHRLIDSPNRFVSSDRPTGARLTATSLNSSADQVAQPGVIGHDAPRSCRCRRASSRTRHQPARGTTSGPAAIAGREERPRAHARLRGDAVQLSPPTGQALTGASEPDQVDAWSQAVPSPVSGWFRQHPVPAQPPSWPQPPLAPVEPGSGWPERAARSCPPVPGPVCLASSECQPGRRRRSPGPRLR